jgi:ferredoxin
MNVQAIYDFLGKISPSPHNLDQLKQVQRLHRISRELAEYIRSKGHEAQEVPPNNTYRRDLNVFSNRPTFSHRFGTMLSGIAGQGLSGNVMTKEYGAAVYLGTVMTSAKLESTPALGPRYFMDNYCAKCNLCAKSCPSRMFVDESEEYVLLNGQLHPRGRRRNLDLCNGACFGLHGLSSDKTWSTWGRHWIRNWVGDKQNPDDRKILQATYMAKGGTVGDAAPRYDFIRKIGSILWPEELVEFQVPEVGDLSGDQEEMDGLLYAAADRMEVKSLLDPNIFTCGQCALVCGPTFEETHKRYRLLIESGIVVPGPNGRMTRVDTFEEAVQLKKQYPKQITKAQMLKDSKDSIMLWKRLYFGFEPKWMVQGWLYDRKLRRAMKKKLPGHAEARHETREAMQAPGL